MTIAFHRRVILGCDKKKKLALQTGLAAGNIDREHVHSRGKWTIPGNGYVFHCAKH